MLGWHLSATNRTKATLIANLKNLTLNPQDAYFSLESLQMLTNAKISSKDVSASTRKSLTTEIHEIPKNSTIENWYFSVLALSELGHHFPKTNKAGLLSILQDPKVPVVDKAAVITGARAMGMRLRLPPGIDEGLLRQLTKTANPGEFTIIANALKQIGVSQFQYKQDILSFMKRASRSAPTIFVEAAIVNLKSSTRGGGQREFLG